MRKSDYIMFQYYKRVVDKSIWQMFGYSNTGCPILRCAFTPTSDNVWVYGDIYTIYGGYEAMQFEEV